MFKALFSAKGRMRRRDFWLWGIAFALAIGVMEVVAQRLWGSGTFQEDTAAFKGLPTNGFHYWLIGVMVVAQWVWVCLYAKRWHDRNRPGWLAAIGPIINVAQFALVHFLNLVDGFSLRFAAGAVQSGLGIAGVIYAIWLLIDCGILDGTPGANRYGPSPKGLGVPQADVF